MKINKISSNLIKPQTPTPQNLKKYKLSVIDKLYGSICHGVILFYESKPEATAINQLQESLARILVGFYPLAGRYIPNDHTVDCNDEGAEFIEAEALDVELTALVEKMESGQLDALLPERHFRMDEAARDPLLSIQATHFPCGGLAIAVSVTHRVFDMSSLRTFIATWSDSANPDKTVEHFPPRFTNIPPLLPYKDLGCVAGLEKFGAHGVDDGTFVKMFRFNKGLVSSLKSKICSNIGERVSGVRVVNGIIAKAMIDVDVLKHGRYRDIILAQTVYLRERTIPPMPKHACGNFAVPSVAPRVHAKDIDIEELVKLLGDSARKCITSHAEILSNMEGVLDIIVSGFEDFVKEASDPNANVISFTDWSRFEFYEADFGWGKPVWTSLGELRMPVTMLLRDKEGDGIEAWVRLNPNDMRLFEENEGIKSFTI